jgi:hypothetical protein
MPRQSLAEISGNSNYKGGLKGRFELTPNWRSHIFGCAAAGQTPKTITDNLNFAPTIVKNTIYQADSRHEHESLHRSSRPKIVDAPLRRHLLREVRANPKI